jgi:uncharacterized protein with PQ loop repeat
MEPHGMQRKTEDTRSPSRLQRVLGFMSIATMLMTIPQVWTIWARHQAAGVSALSWAAYLVSAALWFAYGLERRDRTIYLPCIGWIALDAAVIAGTVMYG